MRLQRWMLCTWLASCALGHVAQAPSPARAQDADAITRDASAREFFEQGVHAAERGDWQEAEDRFRRALSLRASAVLAYNLASALVERGKLLEASELLRRVQNDTTAAPPLKQDATVLQDKITHEISRVAISVKGWQPGDRVLLDGRDVHGAQLGVAIPIDPGSHQLRLERGGSTVALQNWTVAAGERSPVQLVGGLLPAAAQAGPQHAAAPKPATQADESPSITGRWWFWGGAALLVAAGATVAVVAATGGGAKSDSAYRGSVPPGSVAVEVMR